MECEKCGDSSGMMFKAKWNSWENRRGKVWDVVKEGYVCRNCMTQKNGDDAGS